MTLTEAAVRPIQVWVRTAGVIDAWRRIVTATVPAGDGARVKVGQRVWVFSPETRARMYQAEIFTGDVSAWRSIEWNGPAGAGSASFSPMVQ